MADLAAIAGFTATGVGVLNIWLQSHYARRTSTEAWARQEALPSVQRFLAAMREADVLAAVAKVGQQMGFTPPDDTLSRLDQLSSVALDAMSEFEIYASDGLTVHALDAWRELNALLSELKTGNQQLAEEMRQGTPPLRAEQRRLAVLRDDFRKAARREFGVQPPRLRKRRGR